MTTPHETATLESLAKNLSLILNTNVDVNRFDRDIFIVTICKSRVWTGTKDAILLAAKVAAILKLSPDRVTAEEVSPGMFRVEVNGEVYEGTSAEVIAWAEQWARRNENDSGFTPP